jgi:hypothetical protein
MLQAEVATRILLEEEVDILVISSLLFLLIIFYSVHLINRYLISQ